MLGELGVTALGRRRVAGAARVGGRATALRPRRAVADYRTALNAVDAVDVVTSGGEPLRRSRAIAWPPAVIASSRSRWREPAAEGALSCKAAARVDRPRRSGRPRLSLPSGDRRRCAMALGAGAHRRRPLRARVASPGFKRPSRRTSGVTQTDAIHYFDLFAYLSIAAATGE